MNKILIFVLVFISIVFAGKPSLKNALRNKVVIDFKNAIVPIISKQVQHLKLPDIHTDSSGFHFDITSIVVEVHAINPNQINIVFVPNSSSIKFSGSGFSMHGGAHIEVKWLFISKSMGADVNINGAAFECKISLISNKGKPNIKVDGISVHAGNVDIHLNGDIIVKIIEFIVGLLKGHFINEIVGQLQGKLPSLITNEVNKRLNGIPTDISIGKDMAIKYGFPYTPFVKTDYLFTGITAYVHQIKNPNPPPIDIPDLPEFDASDHKGVQFFFSDYILKSSINACYQNQFLQMIIEKDMLGHHVKMVCKATHSPNITFANAIDLIVDSECSVEFDHNATNHFTLVAEVHANLKEYMKHAVIFFSISVAQFKKLEFKQDHPIDIEWFKNGINTVLDVVREFINGEIGQKGIPLPTIPGIDYTDTTQSVKKNYIEICTNPVFHFKSED